MKMGVGLTMFHVAFRMIASRKEDGKNKQAIYFSVKGHMDTIQQLVGTAKFNVFCAL